MKIQILSIRIAGEDMFVTFESSVGLGCAKWGNRTYPVEKCWYDVEIDIDKKISAVPIYSHVESESQIVIHGNKILMSGVIESIEDDGIAYLRLCKDGLLMIELDNQGFSEGDCIELKLNPSDIRVTAQI
jgi:hypothetical protein